MPNSKFYNIQTNRLENVVQTSPNIAIDIYLVSNSIGTTRKLNWTHLQIILESLADLIEKAETGCERLRKLPPWRHASMEGCDCGTFQKLPWRLSSALTWKVADAYL